MLKGIRILDLSRLLPGPYASMLLADLGAEVIKVEDTTAGDYMRDFDPKVNEDSAYYLSVNRNKKSLKLDFKSPEGRELLLRLVKESQVVLESFRPGVMASMGLGYEDLKKVNPGIVYCSMTGYGQTGPYKSKAGHDLNYLSLSGIMDISGIRDGSPVMFGTQVADLSGGMFAVIGILTGIIRQKETGEGCFVDAAMVDGLMSWMSFYVAQFLCDGKPLKRGELDLSGGLVCYNIYQTKDNRYVGLGSLEYKFWKTFCLAIGREDLVKTHMTRAIEGDPVFEEVKNLFREKTLAEWEQILGAVDCCFTPILGIDEVLKGQNFKERGLGVKMLHPTEGELLQVGRPVKITFADGSEYVLEGDKLLPPPKWGQHTGEILSQLGLTPGEINELKAKGVI